jgi:hypothetical protein
MKNSSLICMGWGLMMLSRDYKLYCIIMSFIYLCFNYYN